MVHNSDVSAGHTSEADAVFATFYLFGTYSVVRLPVSNAPPFHDQQLVQAGSGMAENAYRLYELKRGWSRSCC